MELNDFRILVTVVGFVCFVGICIWAWSKHAKAGFDEAARLPLTDDDPPVQEDRQGKEGNTNG
ncbi:cbb3-type cytochrome c oxidase subunit 3 [Pseudothauera nasutitermitis]|uniref:Cbb3-type cytochrome c oxidase subunit 3 n=1 Tax=Pseudothauera nasutitermitis TaxID=2565930 RepID=A0A4S4B039_9RHOO|nr:cbb3-type cytochrome c oxidase subunit 3 [Pseudothauera nasutitermitis]THF65838.1 cbb3-type cytochrome c oxidase subunit 3 [Pseudothauera nasutitermitis]